MRISRDDGTNSPSDLPKVHHDGQERNEDTLCETAKLLYRLLRASLVFYRKLRKEFKDHGIVVNP